MAGSGVKPASHPIPTPFPPHSCPIPVAIPAPFPLQSQLQRDAMFVLEPSSELRLRQPQNSLGVCCFWVKSRFSSVPLPALGISAFPGKTRSCQQLKCQGREHSRPLSPLWSWIFFSWKAPKSLDELRGTREGTNPPGIVELIRNHLVLQSSGSGGPLERVTDLGGDKNPPGQAWGHPGLEGGGHWPLGWHLRGWERSQACPGSGILGFRIFLLPPQNGHGGAQSSQ